MGKNNNKKNNDVIITLTGENGQTIDFKLEAQIEYDDVMYGIMTPVDHFDDLDPDEAFVFRITSDNEGDYFEMEESEETALRVIEIYNEQ